MSISAIIPNFNYASYVQDAISGVLNQTYPASKIIIIDDGSTDHSVEKIREAIQDRPNVTFIRHKKNMGFYMTIEEAVSRVDTEYLFIGASDDYIWPNFFEENIQSFQKDPSIGLSCSIPGFFKGKLPQQPPPLRDGIEIYSPKELAKIIKSNPFWIAGNICLHRTSAFKEFGGLKQEAQIHNDWLLNYLIGFTYGIGYLPKSLGAARMHSESMSVTYEKTEKELFPAYKHILNEIQTRPRQASLFRKSGILNDLGHKIQNYARKTPSCWSFLPSMQIRRVHLKLKKQSLFKRWHKKTYPTYHFS